MTSQRAHPVYDKPPIVEAIVEIGFDTPLAGDIAVQAIESELSQLAYTPDPKGATEEPSTEPSSVRWVRAEGDMSVVGCGPRRMSIHVFAPYPGWAEFCVQIRRALTALNAAIDDATLTYVLIGYVDRIELPHGSQIRLDDYLVCLPPVPPYLKESDAEVTNFHVATEFRDGEFLIQFLIGTAQRESSVDGKSSPPTLLLDLSLQWHVHHGDGPIQVAESALWWDKLELMHSRQRDVFESSITDQMRSLFSDSN